MNSNLIALFQATRSCSEKLCEQLEEGDYNLQATYFTSPPKWHLAHTTWFFEQMILKRFKSDFSFFDKKYNFLFNSYYNSLGQRIERHQRGLITRPSVQKVMEYRRLIDLQIRDLLQANNDPTLIELVTLGINHEQQHQELLVTDLKYGLSQNPTYPAVFEKPFLHSPFEKGECIQIKEGVYEIGHKGNSFHFDNELGFHKTYLQNFEISSNLITNAEYLQFMQAGGYENPVYWLDEGWAWVQQNQITKPLYWHQDGDTWFQYTLAGLQPVDAEQAVCHVSFYEANAYAQFAGKRLPTEFEWEIASKQFDWGKRWEWTNSAYLPYPGFKIKPGAVGEYNGKFMINQMVLRGASNATAINHSRHTYRNFFHPSAQWQFSGIRTINID